MIPIRARHPLHRTPLVTLALVALNTGIFLAYWPLGSDPEVARVLGAGGLVPARVAAGEGWAGFASGLFLHGGWLHLGFNMLVLVVFGPTLEQAFGHWRMAAFYLACGVLAGLTQVLADPGSTVPVVGASGAVAGVLGGYALMLPRTRIEMLVWLVFALRVVAVPAWALMGLWLAIQIAGGLAGSAAVAFWAHLGGFLAGVALTLPWWRRCGGRHVWRRAVVGAVQPEAVPVVRCPGTPLPAPRTPGLFRRAASGR